MASSHTLFQDQYDRLNDRLLYLLSAKREVINAENTTIALKFGDNLAETFNVFAKLSDSSRDVQFAVKLDDLRNIGVEPQIYVVKFLNEKDSDVSEIREPAIPMNEWLKSRLYSPKLAVLETSNKFLRMEYIVYPLVPGKTLSSYSSHIMPSDNVFEKIMQVALDICETLENLEGYNDKLRSLPHNQKANGTGPKYDTSIVGILQGIWDINPGNFIVQENHVILIDFCPMRVNPFDAFISMIEGCFYAAAKVEKTVENPLENVLKDNLNIPAHQVDQFLLLWEQYKQQKNKNFTEIKSILKATLEFKNTITLSN